MSTRSFRWRLLFQLLLFVPLSAHSASESVLEKFENEATKPQKSSSTPTQPGRQQERKNSNEDSDSSDGDDLMNEIVSYLARMVFETVSYPGVYSWERVAPTPVDNQPEEVQATPRMQGEAIIPFARLDASYNRISSRIYALSWRGEVGFGPFAFEFRDARYTERDPDASLEIAQYHFLYRMSLGDYMEMDIGHGQYDLSGVGDNSGPSTTIHLHIYPNDNIGIELRPSWASINGNAIIDHEVAVSYGERYWAARAGYHWLTTGTTSLSGPFLGASIRF